MKIENVKTRLKGDFNAPWISATWEILKGGCQVFFNETIVGGVQKKTPVRTLRKATSRNWNRWKFRRRILNETLKKKKLGIFADFWWAKFWRKGDSLRKQATQLRNEPDMTNYKMSNKERSAQILQALNQAEGYYIKFQALFNDVDPMLGYQIEKFVDFVKIYKKKFKKEPENIRYIPKRYIAYFADPWIEN